MPNTSLGMADAFSFLPKTPFVSRNKHEKDKGRRQSIAFWDASRIFLLLLLHDVVLVYLGCKMTCGGRPFDKSVLYPSQKSFVPHRSQKNGRLGWLRWEARTSSRMHMTADVSFHSATIHYNMRMFSALCYPTSFYPNPLMLLMWLQKILRR